jgi:drug/metabolite transporter (DMT)-like permease
VQSVISVSFYIVYFSLKQGESMSKFGLFAVCISILSVGQILWKIGIAGVGKFTVFGPEFLASLKGVVASPWIWIGSFCYIFGTLIWFNILSHFELSYALPILSLSYVVTMFASRFLFGDHLTIYRALGTIVICLGVYLVSRS